MRSDSKRNTASGSGGRGAVLPAVLLFLFACGLYVNTLGHGYAVDDKRVIVENKFTRMGLKGIPGLLTNDSFYGSEEGVNELVGGRYRPLSLITFAAEYHFFGLNPGISHLLNVLLYGLTVVMLYAALRGLLAGRRAGVAFPAALLFAAHPLHTEVVANIKGRDELLSLIFILACFHFLRQCADEFRVSRAAACVACFALALTAKEGAAVFVLIFPAALYVFTDVDLKRGPALICLALTAAAGLLFAWARFAVTARSPLQAAADLMRYPFAAATTEQHLATVALIFGKYLKLLVLPHPLIWDYSYNQIPLADRGSVYVWISLLIHTGLLTYVVLRLPRRSPAAFALTLIYIPLIPVSNLFFPVGSFMAERFLYVPSIGYCALAAALPLLFAAPRQGPSPRAKRMWAAAAVLLAAAYGLKTVDRNTDWKNDLTLFRADAAHASGNARQRLSLGVALAMEAASCGDQKTKAQLLRESGEQVGAALRICPEYTDAWLGRSFLARVAGDSRGAARYAREAIRLRPGHAPAHLSLAIAGLLGEDPRECIEHCRRAAELRPGYSQAYYWMANAYIRLEEPRAALQSYRQALSLNPAHADAWYNLGVLQQAELGDLEAAEESYRRVLSLKPGFARAWLNLGLVRQARGDRVSALQYIRRACEIMPQLEKELSGPDEAGEEANE